MKLYLIVTTKPWHPQDYSLPSSYPKIWDGVLHKNKEDAERRLSYYDEPLKNPNYSSAHKIIEIEYTP